MIYSDDSKVLVTVDDNIPIVEVSDSHSSTIGADFVWLAKVKGEWQLRVVPFPNQSGNETSPVQNEAKN